MATGRIARVLALASLSVVCFSSCDLSNDEGGPGGGPGNPAPPFPTPTGPSGLFRASLKGIQPQPNGGCYEPRTSKDGRYVAYYAWASNLVAGDTNNRYDVFVRDRDSDANGIFDEAGGTTTERISIADDDVTQGNNDSYYNAVAGDGQFVAFISYSDNLVAGDTNGGPDIFVRDFINDTTTRVTLLTGGGEILGGYYFDYPTISDDGNLIAFSTDAPIDINDTNFNTDVYVRDILNDTTTWVSIADDESFPNSGSYTGYVSGNGQFVVFTSNASNLVAGDTNNTNDVFVRDLVNLTTTRVSIPDLSMAPQTEANSFSEFWGKPISADGRFVAFYSYATNLVPGDTNGVYDVFVHDRDADDDDIFDEVGFTATRRMSADANGVEGNSWNYYGFLSGDGRYVAFLSVSSNLVPGDTNGTYDAFVRDRDTDEDGIYDEPGASSVMRASLASTGAQCSGYSWPSDISEDGATIAFYSSVNGLVPNDTNFQDDALVRERDPDNDQIFDETTTPAEGITTVRVSEVGSTEPAGNSTNPAVSGDGNLVAFQSAAPDVVPNDGNGLQDVFARDVATSANQRVSLTNLGTDPNNQSFTPAISADGQVVAFATAASNLNADDADGVQDIHARNLSGTFLVSRASGAAGTKGNSTSSRPSVSGTGRFIAFDSLSTTLNSTDLDALSDVFVRDTATFSTILVSRATGAGGAKGVGGVGSSNASISSNGQFVAFESGCNNLDGADGDLTVDIYVRDIVNNTTVLVSRATGAAGAKGNGASTNPSISADGRFVAFQSVSTNLDPGDADGIADIYVRDLLTETTLLVSLASNAVKGNGASTNPSISGDGRYVAYQSDATNLVDSDGDLIFDNDVNLSSDVFRTDTSAPAALVTLLVSVSITGTVPLPNSPGAANSANPAISVDGSFVVFQSSATNLVSPVGANFTSVYRVGPLP